MEKVGKLFNIDLYVSQHCPENSIFLMNKDIFEKSKFDKDFDLHFKRLDLSPRPQKRRRTENECK